MFINAIDPIAGGCISMSNELCDVCGDPIPDNYTKYDKHAPVYGPESGDVCHLGCQDEKFEEVYCSL